MKMKFEYFAILAIFFFTLNGESPAQSDHEKNYDIVVYGGSSAGVIAAVKTARMGKSVILIEPGKHLGGLSSGGLGATDIGNKAAIGGMSREFYEHIFDHYYPNSDTAGTMWTFEPHVAEKIFNDMISEENIPVHFEERLNLIDGVKKIGLNITEIEMESGLSFKGRIFIDATYEGDLMAKAGVSYTVGREANKVYGETLNGVQTNQAIYHQFKNKVDPYVIPGNPESGLLPSIQNDGGPGEEGSGDNRVQAYCFRMCLTDAKDNKIPFPKPKFYDPMRYEILLRYTNTGIFDVMKLSKSMPNNKTDTNNKGAFATDNIGMNYDYPDGDYETRERIIKEHENYQKGLMWFLSNDQRVPEHVRDEVNRWGLPRDEFTDNEHWSHQLYIREARRMISDYIMTEHNCMGSQVVDDPIGLAAYTMDSHNVQRYVDENGNVRNEGDVEVSGFPPYPISYRSIIPQKDECTNLLVPVCLSASHIAFGSIRMEPVFMLLGESAVIAAIQAIDSNRKIQNIDYSEMKKELLIAKQILEWTMD